MKLFKWLKGRQQDTEYGKFCFLNVRVGRWGFDGYILNYPKWMMLPRHTDPVEGGKHWRCNIKLWGDCEFHCDKKIFHIGQRINIFRPDLYRHSLITWSRTVKLSFGVAKFDKL